VYGPWADGADQSRVIVNDWNRIYFSSDGGQTFQAR
jgi:hypothetical protein